MRRDDRAPRHSKNVQSFKAGAWAVAVVAVLAACSPGSAIAPSPTSGSATGAVRPNFSLAVHCGVRYASFEGDLWEAVPPVPAISDTVADPSGGGHNRSSVAGRMERLSPSEAVFTATDEPVGVVVHFRRSNATAQPCA